MATSHTPGDVVVPNWWPDLPPIYDISKSYAENAEFGPFMNSKPIPQRVIPPREQWLDFLGQKIASALGVPAGPLLTSRWIELAAALGFDVLTYKSIRSRPHGGHPVPNVVYVDVPDGYLNSVSAGGQRLVQQSTRIPQRMAELAITNSFGMPSKSIEFLREDIPRANASLQDGQVMIVSVTGTPPAGSSGHGSAAETEFVRDFVEVASFAKSCGARIVEANFSCPNLGGSGSGVLYQDPQSVRDIATHLVQALGDTPLVIKVGTYDDAELMSRVFRTAAECRVAAVCGINSVSMNVTAPGSPDRPALGEGRLTSGVCGAPIKRTALDFVRRARSVIDKEQLNLTLMGGGGICVAGDFQEFLDAGAQVAMTATGMMWDPYLAARYHSLHHTKTAVSEVVSR